MALEMRETCADLTCSQSLTEGEAFLVNNLTKVAHSECGIQRWSLVLRHRQRFALRYLNKDLHLPERPRYNYTWDTYRQTLQDQAFYGMFNQPAQSSSRDLYEKEREEYDRKLEAYAAAVRNGAQWTELVQEKVLWQTETDMGEMPDQRHGECISCIANTASLLLRHRRQIFRSATQYPSTLQVRFLEACLMNITAVITITRARKICNIM